ncbi:MAG TPA: COQ9 family protein [Stellaceae bacterium]
MNSPLTESQRSALIEAILPEVPFDGWSRAALRASARRCDITVEEAHALFPRGAADLVAGFSRWADQRMLDRLEAEPLADARISDRIAQAIATRLEIVEPWREAVRRSLLVLALPHRAPLGARLVYDTVDAMWYAAGDAATDFSFYTKRASLAAIYSATLLYWLDDRSEGFAETRAFVDRRLAGMARFGRLRRDLDTVAERMPNPLRLLRPLR